MATIKIFLTDGQAYKLPRFLNVIMTRRYGVKIIVASFVDAWGNTESTSFEFKKIVKLELDEKVITMSDYHAEFSDDVFCADCGGKIDESYDDFLIDGKHYCASCVTICGICGEIIRKDGDNTEPAQFRYGSGYCHTECAERAISKDEMFRCEDCDVITSVYHRTEVHLADGTTRNVCNRCADNYRSCDRCGHFFEVTDEMREAEDSNVMRFCPECYEMATQNICRWVHNYSHKPDPHFLGTNARNGLFLGVELEIDKGKRRKDCGNAIHDLDKPEHEFYMKCDGSLNNGIEIVTHPATLDYHLNILPWADISKAAAQNGFTSHDARTCGLHVHVSRAYFGDTEQTRDNGAAKIILLVLRHWVNMVKFSRRNENELSQWARKNDVEDDIRPSDTIQTIAKKCKNTFDDHYKRYQAVNLENHNTVEFRMFRGTLNVNTIKATLQLVNNICVFAKNNSLRKVMASTWDDIAGSDYPELNTYLNARGIPAKLVSNTDTLHVSSDDGEPIEVIHTVDAHEHAFVAC